MAFNLYSGNYKRLLFVPLILTLVFAFLAFVSPGLESGLDISGGTLLLVQTNQPADVDSLENMLRREFDLLDLKVSSTGGGVRIQFSDSASLADARELVKTATEQLEANQLNAADLSARAALYKLSRYWNVETLNPQDPMSVSPHEMVAYAQEVLVKADEAFGIKLQSSILSHLQIAPQDARFQKREIGAALGQLFWENAIQVTLIALVCIAIVVFLFFREIVPSLGIIAGILFDILSALAFMALLRIPLSLATIPALLMLIGYSIDGEILLNTRVFKKKEGTERERAMDSLGTGMTMTLTALVGALLMMALSFSTGISLIFEISAVLVGGLLGDIIVTWFGSAPFVLWYAEHKEKKKALR